MYWADWGDHPMIETAAMDGTMRETLVEENIEWPTGKTDLSPAQKLKQTFESVPYRGVCLCRSDSGLLQRASVLG